MQREINNKSLNWGRGVLKMESFIFVGNIFELGLVNFKGFI